MIKQFNIFIIGVGGQGIGLLSEIIQRAIDNAGIKSLGVDTHGLAQRGGTVTSHIRMGSEIYSPLIRENNADLVIALERHEALRAVNQYSAPHSTLLYYDAVWQPLDVRMKLSAQIENVTIEESCSVFNIKSHKIFITDLPDSKMQNIALLASLAKFKLLPDISINNYLTAMNDVINDRILTKNLELFEKIAINLK